MEGNVNNLIYKCLVGSKAYGTDFPHSDTDYKGIYIQNQNDILGFKYKEQYEIGKDETYYEIKRFLELAKSANPTILEMLFMPEKHIAIKNDCLEELFENKHLFITKKCFDSFGGYAVAQIKKAVGLSKKMNWEKEKTIRKTPLDFCYAISAGKTMPITKFLSLSNLKQEYCGLAKLDHAPNTYALYYDYVSQFGEDLANPIKSDFKFKGIAFEDSNDIRLSSIPKDLDCLCVLYYNKDAYSMHCKDYNSYQVWLSERNENRYVDIKEHNQKIDGKNMLHCVRLLDCCLEIAETGTFAVERPNPEYLKSIRKGEINFEKLIDEAEEKLRKLNELKKSSSLPDEVNKDFLHNLLVNIRNKYEKSN